MQNSNSGSVGSFIATTNIWDVSQIYAVDVNSAEFKELLVRLYQNLNLMATNINIRDAGYYDTQEFVNGQLYFPNPAYSSQTSPSVSPAYRQVYRKVINCGTLPDTASKTIPHLIDCTAATTFTRIYGVANDVVAAFNYIPLPYASPTLANNIELSVDATNVTITTGSNRTNFTITYVVLEYLQN